MYCFKSRIRYSECDDKELLTLVGLLNYFQDVSTFQSEDLGVGVEALHERGTLWVVNSWQIDIIRLPRLCEEVEVWTRPYECRGFFGRRNFYMKDRNGEYLAKADSLWTYISMEDATPVRINDEIIEAYGHMPKIDMDYLGRKISVPKKNDEALKSEQIPVTEHLLDANHHVNNGKYVELAAGFIPEGESADRIRVEYRKQAFLGDTIYPYIFKKEGFITVKLADEKGDPYAVVEFSRQNI
ncbi:MAG: acyl-[acyl-carrier-protein] thioesterase [Lachnospiraceae bacterium]|nr:acyl-[acyl-carrier-protein] thioesterase [Lachnospiraceae bacterium]